MSEITFEKNEASLRISFLHTVEVNQPVFHQAAIAIGFSPKNILHELRSDLREEAEKVGRLTENLKALTVSCLLALAARSDVVVLTCSTLGSAVEGLDLVGVPILRTDTVLPRLVSAMDGKIAVLCAAESALVSQKHLYQERSEARLGSLAVVHLPHVWDLFRSGEREAYLAAIASAASREYEAGTDIVTFAHPWMAPAAELVLGEKRPFDIPNATLELAVQRGLDKKVVSMSGSMHTRFQEQ